MRPVNLLPRRYRPRAGAAGSKASYAALGALALLVLAVLGYVMAANKVSSRNEEIAQTRQQIAAAEAQAVTLEGFGNFAGIKQARLDAVRSLATARLDWERLFRELAHVLPAGVWLTGFDGTATSSGGTGDGEALPSGLVLKGCARDHQQIADVLVRLRELHLAADVTLTRTAGAEDESAGTGSADEGGCGPYYSFEAKVEVDPATLESASASGTAVPARLGGGG